MPFIDDAEPAGLAPQIAEPLKMPGEPGWRAGRDIDVPVPSFEKMFEAAWRRENTLGSLKTSVMQPDMAPFDASFDPWRNIAGYEDHARAFIGANDEIDVMHIKTRIDDERRRRETLDAGGWQGMLVGMGAGLVDPINLIPFGGQVVAATRAGRVLAGALRVGATGALSQTAVEGVLQATQIDRSLAESSLNIAGNAVFGAALGGVSVAAHTFIGSPIGGLVGFFGPDGDEDVSGDEDAAEDDGQDEGANERINSRCLSMRCVGMSRSIRLTRKAHIRADKSRHGGSKSFFGGLLAGLSAATLVHDHTRRPRSYGGAGVSGDWQAVGDDIRAAMQE